MQEKVPVLIEKPAGDSAEVLKKFVHSATESFDSLKDGFEFLNDGNLFQFTDTNSNKIDYEQYIYIESIRTKRFERRDKLDPEQAVELTIETPINPMDQINDQVKSLQSINNHEDDNDLIETVNDLC